MRYRLLKGSKMKGVPTRRDRSGDHRGEDRAGVEGVVSLTSWPTHRGQSKRFHDAVRIPGEGLEGGKHESPRARVDRVGTRPRAGPFCLLRWRRARGATEEGIGGMLEFPCQPHAALFPLPIARLGWAARGKSNVAKSNSHCCSARNRRPHYHWLGCRPQGW